MNWIIVDADQFELEVLSNLGSEFWGKDMKPVLDALRKSSKGVYLRK